jgi:hypothetical protein
VKEGTEMKEGRKKRRPGKGFQLNIIENDEVIHTRILTVECYKFSSSLFCVNLLLLFGEEAYII